MVRLSKRNRKLHDQAVSLLSKETLSSDDIDFFLANWNEGADIDNQRLGAFFTPIDMAFDFVLDAIGQLYPNQTLRIIDLCAGIGTLSLAAHWRYGDDIDITCVEFSSTYCDIGKKLLPSATWICADISDVDVISTLSDFDLVISNPPFGAINTINNPFSYNIKNAEFQIIEIASKLAKFGAFILPQGSCPFKFSGQQCFSVTENAKYNRFVQDTGITLSPGMGCDTTVYNSFKNTSVTVEFVHAEF